jgi:hypothetical protein
MFTDANGLAWHPKVTILTVERFEQETGLNLFRKETFELLNKAEALPKICRLAFLACPVEVKERSMAYEEFASGLSSMAIVQNVTQSVMGAIELFSQRAPEKASS